MYRLEFQIDGDKALSRVIRLTGGKIKNMRKEFAQIGQVVRESAIDNIDNQGSEGGGAWKPLSQRTIKARSERRGYYKKAPSGAGPSTPILVWTGKLKQGFRSTPKSQSVTIDNPVPYFKYHQSKERGNARLPRRLVLELKQADKVKAMSIIAQGLNDALEGGNFGRQV